MAAPLPPAPPKPRRKACLSPGFIVFILVCFGFGVYSAYRGLNSDSVDLSNAGFDAYNKGDYKTALADYDKAIAADPKNSVIYNNRGLAKHDAGDLDGALADYTKAIALDPKNDIAYNQRGSAKLDKNDLDGALADFNRAIQLNPQSAFALAGRGDLEFQRAELDKALVDYLTAVELKPNDGDMLYKLGFAQFVAGKEDAALANFHASLQANPDGNHMSRFFVWQITARNPAQRAAADKELADYYFQPGATRDPWMAMVAQYLTGKMPEDEFLKRYITGNSIAGVTAEAYFFVGLKHRADGDPAGATAAFKKCVAQNETQTLQYQIARLLLPQG